MTVHQDESGNLFFAAKPKPALREKKPGQVAPQPAATGISVVRGASSGNPNADPASGRFASKSGGDAPAGGGGNLIAKLTDSAKEHIKKQMQSTGADRFRLVAQGTEIQVILTKGGQQVASFVVPSTDSSEEVNNQFVGQAGVAGDPQRSSVPAGADPEAWQRRVDAVRDIARENDVVSAGDAKELLKARGVKVSQVDMDQLLHDVSEQRLDDLADIFDQQLRNKITGMKKTRRFVKVSAPRGWQKRVFAGLDDDQVLKLLKRLEGKGFDPKDLTDNVISKISNEERRTKLEQLYGEQSKKSGKKEKK